MVFSFTLRTSVIAKHFTHRLQFISIVLQTMKPDTSCISWKSFQPSLSATLKKLYTENIYADVTLVSDDQIQIQAHRFVLSACSPTMENLLLNNIHPHPMLYMRGVDHQEMRSILQFMYIGEANIKQERIDKFLVCQRFAYQ